MAHDKLKHKTFAYIYLNCPQILESFLTIMQVFKINKQSNQMNDQNQKDNYIHQHSL